MVMLEVELKYLEDHRKELLEQYGGKFLVIKGQEVLGSFDTFQEALKSTASSEGLTNVLIRRPVDGSDEISIPALTLGILSANNARTGVRSGTRS